MTEYERGGDRDLLYWLQHLIYVDRHENFHLVAAQPECSLEELAALSVAGWLRDHMGNAIRPAPNGTGTKVETGEESCAAPLIKVRFP